MEEPIKTGVEQVERDERGRVVSGSLNPNGRPKGKTMKEYAREYFLLKTEEEKKAYIDYVEEKKPGFAWEMAEGKAKQDMEVSGEMVSKVIRLDVE